MPKNPIGLCVQPQAKDFDRAKFVEHVRKAEYTTCQILDDQQLAIDLNIPYAVFRDYNMEPHPGNNPQSVARQTMAEIREIAARPGGRNILYYINNEPEWSKNRNLMYAEMIEISANDPSGPIGLCVGNYGSGRVKSGQGADPNWWATPDAELLLKTLHKYRNVKLPNGSYAFVLGLDEYTGLFPWIASNGAEKRFNPQWEHRPSSIDLNKDQWHLLRSFQGIVEACQKWGIEPPWILIEEALIDTMDDVIYTFGSSVNNQHNLKLAAGADKPQGWRTLIPQYAIWYPGKDPEDVLADFHIWDWEVVYAPFKYILAMTIYCAWDASGDAKGQPANRWKWFRVDNAPKYLKRMENYRHTVTTVPPVEPPPPQPVTTAPPASDPRWYETLAYTYADTYANIRADETETSADLGDFKADKPGRKVKVIYMPRENPYFPLWDTSGTGVRGWCNELYVVYGKPPMPTVDDPRWEEYKAVAPGVTAPVRDWCNAQARTIGGIIVGGVVVKHIPQDKLTAMEKTYLDRWNVLMVNGLVGYVQPNVRFDAIDTTPPPKVVTIPEAEYNALKAVAEELPALRTENTKLKDVIIGQKAIVDDYQELRRLLTKPIPSILLQEKLQ